MLKTQVGVRYGERKNNDIKQLIKIRRNETTEDFKTDY